jgi:hypothetical protein
VMEYDVLCGLGHVEIVGEVFGFGRAGAGRGEAQAEASGLAGVESPRLINRSR